MSLTVYAISRKTQETLNVLTNKHTNKDPVMTLCSSASTVSHGWPGRDPRYSAVQWWLPVGFA